MFSVGCYPKNRFMRPLLSELGATTTVYDGHGTDISPDSMAPLKAIQSLNVSDMSPAWTQAEVDAVLKSATDALHLNANHYSYAGPALNIGGSANEAPSHLDGYFDPLVVLGAAGDADHWDWDAVLSKHKAKSGGACLWALTHNPGTSKWNVTYNGGVAIAKIVGTAQTSFPNFGAADRTYYTQYTAAYSGKVGDINLSCGGSSTVRVALYTDNADSPGLLKASGSGSVVSSDKNLIPLNVAYDVVSGAKYWLAYQVAANNVVKGITTGGVRKYTLEAYGTPFVDNPTVSAADTIDYAITGWGLQSA